GLVRCLGMLGARLDLLANGKACLECQRWCCHCGVPPRLSGYVGRLSSDESPWEADTTTDRGQRPQPKFHRRDAEARRRPGCLRVSASLRLCGEKALFDGTDAGGAVAVRRADLAIEALGAGLADAGAAVVAVVVGADVAVVAGVGDAARRAVDAECRQ